MLSGILSKAYDVVSGKNSDLSAIDAAYTGVESSVARPAAYSSVFGFGTAQRTACRECCGIGRTERPERTRRDCQENYP